MVNPLLAGKPLVFLQRRRFICQMLHEYLAYYYDGISGGGVFVLDKPGQSFATRDVLAGRLPEGNYTTLALSYDAKTIYFAFAEKSADKGSFYTPSAAARHFRIYAVNADGSNLRRLTNSEFDDFDPCPLPDGGIAFMSTRRAAASCRCNNPWEPLPAYTLHRMDADGHNVRTLSFHETNEWHPSVLDDGRIVYIRWDYVDRSAANFHGLWVTNPDGTNPASIFGNYTSASTPAISRTAIPGSKRIAVRRRGTSCRRRRLAGAFSTRSGHALDARSGEDRLDAVEVLTPEVCFPEAAGWPKSYFHSPWPLSENYFLVSFSFDPLPGMSSGNTTDAQTGIYYFDRFGNLELLYRQNGIASMYPIPLVPRPVPPVVENAVDKSLGNEGEFMLTDVRQSLMPLPADRPIKALRIFQVLPKTTHMANEPRIGHANAESARMLLGTVPVEADGSAYFRVPAGKPLYFQAVDAKGRAVQSMRSVTYLQPGERRGCVGCHEPSATIAPPRETLALQRGASVIQPGPDGTRPFSYPRLVQPVLDRHCVRCHDGSSGEGKSKLVLTGEAAPKSTFSRSYENLRPYLRWYEWGGASITQIATPPGRIGADESRLLKVLGDKNHRAAVTLPKEDRLRLVILA